MSAWLMTHGLGPWGTWIAFVAYLAGTVMVAWLVKYLLRGVIHRLAARTAGQLDDRLMRGGQLPLRLTILALGFRSALQVLRDGMPTLAGSVWFLWVERIGAALVVLAATALVSGLLRAALDWYVYNTALGNQAAWDKELLPIVRRLLSGVLYFIALSSILSYFGMNISALVTTAGVASLAVALAAQETLGNMLGGFTLLMDRPFKVGDVIELADGKSGEVYEIGIRSTRITQFDGTLLVVPNKDIANTRVVNYALPTPRVAVRQTFTLDAATDVAMAKRVLTEVMTAHPEVLKEPEPGVWLTKLGAGTIDIALSCWVVSYRDRFRITDELNQRWLEAVRANRIRLPHPQQDVHLDFADDALAASTGGKTQAKGEA